MITAERADGVHSATSTSVNTTATGKCTQGEYVSEVVLAIPKAGTNTCNRIGYRHKDRVRVTGWSIDHKCYWTGFDMSDLYDVSVIGQSNIADFTKEACKALYDEYDVKTGKKKPDKAGEYVPEVDDVVENKNMGWKATVVRVEGGRFMLKDAKGSAWYENPQNFKLSTLDEPVFKGTKDDDEIDW